MSSHSKCLMCETTKGLHVIKPEAILFAYKNFGILMKKDSRRSQHVESNGQIKYEEYLKIRKKHIPLTRLRLKCLMNAEKILNKLNDSSGIFDKFRDIASLDEDICKKITGWSKLDLVKFSGYIRNSKEQLIAIYRYWLLKGLYQTTLALMKCNTSQQQNCLFLAQIRSANNEEFVPEFLGAQKGKDIFFKA